MATIIKLKRGITTPTTSDLANGEVGIDTSAQKFYINDNGTIKQIIGNEVEAAALGGDVRAYTGDGSTTAFTVSSGSDVENLLVFINGVYQRPTTDYTVSGTTLTFSTAPANADSITIKELVEGLNSIFFADDSSTTTELQAGNTLVLSGGTGIATTLTGDTATFAIDNTVTTNSGTQTLTNKTIDSANNTITITESNISDLGSYITASSTDTLTNKTIDAANNTLSNIGNSSLTNSSITVTDGSTSTATSLGGTITFSGTANEIEVGESSGTITIGLPDNVTIGGNATVTGNLTVNGTTTTVNSTTIEITNSFTFEGSTADDYETVLGVIDPTADRTINLPNVSGTVITSGNLSDITSLDATSIADGSVSNTEFQYLNGVTSAIQTQLDAKATNAFAIAQAVALG